MSRLSLAVITILIFFGGHDACFGAAKSHDAYNEALIALKNGNTTTAVDLLTKAIAANPSNHLLYNDRGVAYKRLGNLEKALQDYTRALEIEPGYINALNNRGVAFVQQARYPEAIKDFNKALDRGDLNGKLYSNLAIALTLNGNYSEAIPNFEKAASFHKLDPKTLMALGEAYENIGQKEKALKTYKKAGAASNDPALTSILMRKAAALEPKAEEKPLPKLQIVKSDTSGFKEKATTPKVKATTPKVKATTLKEKAPIQAKATQIAKASNNPAKSEEKPPIQPQPEPPLDSIGALESLVRSKSLEKVTPAASEIYKQGRSFAEQSDYVKALVRFEDVVQLERRAKNLDAVAMSLIEIGRVHAKMGDTVKAEAALGEAVKDFNKTRHFYGAALALAEAALVKKNSGQKGKAKELYSKISEIARTKGYERLSRLLSEVAEDKPPARKTIAQKKEPVPAVAAPLKSEDKIAANPKSSFKWGLSGAALLKKADQRKSAVPAPPSSSQEAMEKADAGNQRIIKPAPEISYKAKIVAVAPVAGITQTASRNPAKGPAQNIPAPTKQTEVTRVAPEQASIIAAAEPIKNGINFLSPKSPGVSGIGQGPVKNVPPAKSLASLSPTESVSKKQTEKPSTAPVGLSSDVGRAELRSAKPISRKEDEKAIRRELNELRKLKKADNEAAMIPILERLADRYGRTRAYDKALHAVSAALSFREKYGSYENMENTLVRSGFMKEQAGDLSGAVEDYSRAAAIFKEKSAGQNSLDTEQRVKRLATVMGLDGGAVVQAFNKLWKGRSSGANETETAALYYIAGLYERASRPSDALVYYERSTASMLADKARVYEKMGKVDEAQQSYDRAMEAFKKYDYPKYLDLKKKGKGSKKVSGEFSFSPVN